MYYLTRDEDVVYLEYYLCQIQNKKFETEPNINLICTIYFIYFIYVFYFYIIVSQYILVQSYLYKVGKFKIQVYLKNASLQLKGLQSLKKYFILTNM